MVNNEPWRLFWHFLKGSRQDFDPKIIMSAVLATKTNRELVRLCFLGIGRSCKFCKYETVFAILGS